MIAALFVSIDGVYFNLCGVDPWDVRRDARQYLGPFPVVAHPPCERWGRYWSGGPNPKSRRRLLGADDGCFLSALSAVRQWGGVLEHPEGSHAWRFFNLRIPPRRGGWILAGDGRGITCCVEQGNYGHPARKATWLYACGVVAPPILWGAAKNKIRIDEGFNSKTQADIARHHPSWKPRRRLSTRERVNTPVLFRDLMIAIARSVRAKK